MHELANFQRSYIFNILVYVILRIWITPLIEYIYLKIHRMDNFKITEEEVLKSKEPLLLSHWHKSIMQNCFVLLTQSILNPLNTELNPISHLLALLGAHTILHISRIKVNVLEYKYKFNPLNSELNPICCLLALLAHHFLHVTRIRVKSLTLRLLMSYIYIYGAPILDVSRSHTTTQHSR